MRYERYSKAKTVGQSLALGAYPIDWIYDYEHGFIKAGLHVIEAVLIVMNECNLESRSDMSSTLSDQRCYFQYSCYC